MAETSVVVRPAHHRPGGDRRCRLPGWLLRPNPGGVHARRRQLVTWHQTHGIALFEPRRAEINFYTRHLGERSAVDQRRPSAAASTISSFYGYASEDGLIPHSPPANGDANGLDYKSQAIGNNRTPGVRSECPSAQVVGR